MVLPLAVRANRSFNHILNWHLKFSLAFIKIVAHRPHRIKLGSLTLKKPGQFKYEPGHWDKYVQTENNRKLLNLLILCIFRLNLILRRHTQYAHAQCACLNSAVSGISSHV